MGLLNALTSAPGLRQFAPAPSFELPDDYRAFEPGLDTAWGAPAPEPEPEEATADDNAAPGGIFLVCRQSGMSPRGEPLFGEPHASSDDNLALSEDGYLINGDGLFLLGMPLDEEGRAAGRRPEVVRLDTAGLETMPTARILYRANLPSFPMTANADFDVAGSELLDKTLFARDPSVQGSGIVLGDERMKFLDRSLAGGSARITAPDGQTVQLVLRWAKATSLRSAGRDCWNLFYRVRREPRPGEVAWKNIGHQFVFGAEGRLEEASLAIPVIDMLVDGVRLGNVSMIFGSAGVTQFADRAGLVKVLKAEADGHLGGDFSGISLSARGRLFAHYTNAAMRPLADIHFPGEDAWFEPDEASWRRSADRRVA
jgi:flagellar hook protein FlgE